MTRRDFGKPAFSLRKLRENTCTIASGDYSTPVSQRPTAKKQIMTSRSFDEKLTEFADLHAAVTYFAARAGEKCRRQQLAAQALTMFIFQAQG